METVRIGFGMRLVAALIDGVIAAVLVWVPSLVLGSIHPALGAIVGGALAMGYYSLEVFRARTVGKTVFKYAITKRDGSPATRDQLVKRYAYKQVPQALMVVAAIPMLGLVSFVAALAALAIVAGALMALKPEKLALHDQLFGTAVYGPATVSVTIPQAKDFVPAPAPVANAAATAQAA